MQIFTEGRGEKNFTPDQIQASITFRYHANTYDRALKGGVEKVKDYINAITKATDFTANDFKTRAYSVLERTHTNKLNPETHADLDKILQKTVSEGFFFAQLAHIKFDYDKERLTKLLVISSKIPNAPKMHIDFTLKDVQAKKLDLIQEAFVDAKIKAEALAKAANKNLRDCIRVEIDKAESGSMFDEDIIRESAFGGYDSLDDFKQEIKNIDGTFKPDDITLSKTISCVWETEN